MEIRPISSFAEIETKNLLLRRLGSNDLNEIFAIRSNPKIAEFLDRPLCKSTEEALQFINKISDGVKNNAVFYWAITNKNSPGLLGTICLWNFSEKRPVAEVGFEMLPSFQGKGIMSEALEGVIHFGFNKIGLISIEGVVHKNNLRSLRLLEKFKFSPKSGPAAENNPDLITYYLDK